MKRCSKCQDLLPLTAFSRRGQGHKSECRDCAAKYMQQRYPDRYTGTKPQLPYNRSRTRGSLTEPKQCNKCLRILPATQFCTRGTRCLNSICRTCAAAISSKDTEGNRRRKARYKYGLSASAFARLKHAHPHCGICGKAEPTCIDHCHDTGQVRGLLCLQCNSALGYMQDDPDRLRAAADYLERHA